MLCQRHACSINSSATLEEFSQSISQHYFLGNAMIFTEICEAALFKQVILGHLLKYRNMI